jgi:hypothetical protein
VNLLDADLRDRDLDDTLSNSCDPIMAAYSCETSSHGFIQALGSHFDGARDPLDPRI